ncbi:MAG: hypothetical protein ACFCU6_13795 [Balneolaceae bacterium]
MKNDDNDKILRRLYSEVRNNDSDKITSFDTIWERAEKQRLKNRYNSYLKMAAVFLVISTGISWLLFTNLTADQAGYEFDSMVIEWEMPTDELLVFSDNFYEYDFFLETDELLNINENNEEADGNSNF